MLVTDKPWMEDCHTLRWIPAFDPVGCLLSCWGCPYLERGSKHSYQHQAGERSAACEYTHIHPPLRRGRENGTKGVGRQRRRKKRRVIVNLRSRITKWLGAGSGSTLGDLPCMILGKLLNISMPIFPQSGSRK